MTDLIYMEDINGCYIKDLEATVESVDEENMTVVLDRTIFYPLGGGQPNDTGSLKWKGGSCRVINVRKKNKILHFIKGDLPPVGARIIGEIDWDRRYAHMRMHTAQHLLSAVIWDHFRASTVGNQIHEDHSHIDFYPAEFSMDELMPIQNEINGLITEGRNVGIEEYPREKIEKEVEKDRVDLSRLPSSIKELRTVLIGDRGSIDLCPCAGTHVKDIKELKGLKITKRKSKGKGKVRIQYILL